MLTLIKDFEVDEMKKMILESSQDTSIYVGCDSQVTRGKVDFVTVVIVHFASKHGAKIFYKKQKEARLMKMRERLWKEVELVSSVALELIDIIGDRYLSIHLDLNPDVRHKSSVIIQEAVGYIRALGFDCKVKPNAFASSYASDHIVKNKMK